MRTERFTEKTQEALQVAASLAAERGRQSIEPEHLLVALIQQEEGLTRPLLQAAGADPVALEPSLVSAVERFPRVSGGADAYISQPLRRVLEDAEKEAGKLKDEYTSTEHLLLAMTSLPLLQDAGVTHDSLLNALQTVRGHQRVTDATPEEKYQALEKYGRDLTRYGA